MQRLRKPRRQRSELSLESVHLINLPITVDADKNLLFLDEQLTQRGSLTITQDLLTPRRSSR